jgi:hypothetical protein
MSQPSEMEAKADRWDYGLDPVDDAKRDRAVVIPPLTTIICDPEMTAIDVMTREILPVGPTPWHLRGERQRNPMEWALLLVE